MNILKAFKEDKYMDMAFDNFVQYSGKHREISLSQGIVTTLNHDKVWFRTIDSLDKAHWLGGVCFQRIDFTGFHGLIYDVDEEIIHYLNSRVRG